MKTINETFDDEEFKLMQKIKDGLSWHDFFILLTTHAKESIKRGDLEIYNQKKLKKEEKK